MSTSIAMSPAVDPARGHAEERAQIGGLTAATASKGDAALFRLFITPLEVWNKVVATGVAKAKYSWPKKILLSFLAGAYLSFGMAFAFLVGGQLKNIKVDDPGLYNVILGFFGLPFGLTMVILMGSDLYTSDVTFMLAAWCEGKTKMTSVVWNLVHCWFGNLCGSLFIVQMYLWGDVFSGREAYEEGVSVKKTAPDFGVNFVRGMLCNWLVNIATWQAMTAQDVTGKFVGVLIPVTIFVASGFEHCIANQFGIPMGMRLGGPAHYVSTSEAIVKNYIPVTLGNSVAAMIFIVGFYFFSIGTGHDMVVNSWNATVTRYLPHWLASWLQTGDVLATEGGLQPLSGKFIGDISVHYGGGGGASTPSHRGISAALRALTSSMRGTHAPPPAAVVSHHHGSGEANGKATV